MPKIAIIYFLFVLTTAFSQQNNSYEDEIEETSYEYSDDENYFEANYNLDNNYQVQRQFKDNLKEKYTGADFTYTQKKEKKKRTEQPPEINLNTNISDSLSSFMTTFFPYLLALLVIIILVKTYVKPDNGFWKFGKISKKKTEKLIYEDEENIADNDFENLIKRAVKNKDYRLATRYYYLALLQKLSQKNLIEYHKDKTNTEYLFELAKNKRKGFSYLAYLYDYVWYGEFAIDEAKFASIQKQYNNYLKAI